MINIRLRFLFSLWNGSYDIKHKFSIVWSPSQGAIRVISLGRRFVFGCHVKRLMTMDFLSPFWYHVSLHSFWVSFLSTNFILMVNRCFDVSSWQIWKTRAETTLNKGWKRRCDQFSVTRGWGVDKGRRLLLSNGDWFKTTLFTFSVVSVCPYGHVIRPISYFWILGKSMRMRGCRSHQSLHFFILLLW